MWIALGMGILLAGAGCETVDAPKSAEASTPVRYEIRFSEPLGESTPQLAGEVLNREAVLRQWASTKGGRIIDQRRVSTAEETVDGKAELHPAWRVLVDLPGRHSSEQEAQIAREIGETLSREVSVRYVPPPDPKKKKSP